MLIITFIIEHYAYQHLANLASSYFLLLGWIIFIIIFIINFVIITTTTITTATTIANYSS